ncbi:MAG TPA: AAA family ATPase [Polyangiaceae bacterium]|nr:AAA family ATPase [Polyangiaceae bacterium]
MITKLRVQNFKCLRDVTLGLGPLTVLIGPNDSGKSSLLDALYLLCKTTTAPDLWSVFQGTTSAENLRWRRERELDLRWELEARVEAADFTYTFELTSDGTYVEDMMAPGRFSFSGRTPFADPGARNRVHLIDERDGRHHRLPRDPNRSALGALGYDQGRRVGAWPFLALLQTNGRYRLSTDALRSPSVPTPGAVLSPTGDNLAAVVDAILGGPDREARVAFETALEAIIPTLRGVTTPPAAGGEPGAKEVHFVLAGTNGKRPVTIPGALASDGAMLVTAFLALAYGPTPDLLLIEEPENGLHPARVGEIMELLRRMSRGEVGDRPRQIIVTTHNPLFLNQARPEEVRVVQRDLETGTRVTPLADVKDIDEMLKDFGIGELWALLGEKGLVEGATP